MPHRISNCQLGAPSFLWGSLKATRCFTCSVWSSARSYIACWGVEQAGFCVFCADFFLIYARRLTHGGHWKKAWHICRRSDVSCEFLIWCGEQPVPDMNGCVCVFVCVRLDWLVFANNKTLIASLTLRGTLLGGFIMLILSRSIPFMNCHNMN